MKTIATVILTCLLSCNCFATTKTRGIILIGNPRGLTTVFERYIINRGDFKVYHEPIVTHRYSLLYPDNFKSPFASNLSEAEILNQIYQENTDKPFFVKELAALLVDNQTIIDMVRNAQVKLIFLIRKPQQSVLSHFKLRNKLPWVSNFNKTEQEVDYAHMQRLFLAVKDATGNTPILIDADNLLANPQSTLKKLCALIDIPFKEQDLQWQAGESSLWSGDADSWQYNVTHSTGFQRNTKTHKIEDIAVEHRAKLLALIKHNQKIYENLIPFKIN